MALRNLLRKVYVAGGKESRVPLGMFTAAVRVGGNGEGVEGDEVECLLANIIYKVCLSFPSIPTALWRLGIPLLFRASA